MVAVAALGFDRVMLVDDSVADNVYHRIVLEAGGLAREVQCHESPRDALEALLAAAPRPALVLLDTHMPELDGWGFAARLQCSLAPEDWPLLLMMSASALGDDRERALAMPIVRGFVLKPLDAERVRAALAAAPGA